MRKKFLNPHKTASFTLLEMLIVLGVVSILASITVLVLKPAELMREGRDSIRIQDIRNIDKAITLSRIQSPSLLKNVLSDTLYISLPSADSDINDNCKDDHPSLPSLTDNWQYRCNATSTTLRKTDGTGWLPIDFTSIVGGAGISVLPIDPKNTVEDNLYYTFSLGTSGTSYSLSANLQSQKYLAQIAATDGGNATSSFETAPIAWTTTTSPMPSWSYRKKITIDQLLVDADLTDFPVLVKLTAANFDFSKARSDGYDIRFTDSGGQTLLKYERERHDSVNDLAEYWVKIPSVSGSVNTEFYIYYGNSSAANGEDATNVWDSNHKAVWHKKNLTTSSIKDSTAYNNASNKLSANNPIETTGKIGKAQSYDGNDDRIEVPASAGSSLDIDANPVTIGVWIKVNSLVPVEQGVVVRGLSNGVGQGSEGHAGIWIQNTGLINWGSTGGGNFNSVSALTTDVWYHVVGIMNGTNSAIYINGNLDATGSTNVVASNYQLNIGASQSTIPGTWTDYFNGLIDEVRVSNAVRSAAWIKADYNSGNNSLLSLGGEEGI